MYCPVFPHLISHICIIFLIGETNGHNVLELPALKLMKIRMSVLGGHSENSENVIKCKEIKDACLHWQHFWYCINVQDTVS